MPVNRRRKKIKFRGSHTHGWGSKKKHRGKGHQGGAGMAGSGKRADSKKPSLWHERYFGKRGFVKKNIRIIVKPVNISFIDENIGKLVEKKLAKKGTEGYEINIADLGFNKLLGTGKVKNKLKINALRVSKKAAESVKAAGGNVIVEKAEKNESAEKHSNESA